MPHIADRLGRVVSLADWRWPAALGLVAGAGLGLAGFLALETWWWLPLWGLVFLGLGWLGWDAKPQLARPLVAPAAPRVTGPRPVRDGPFVMVELPGGEFLMGSPDGDTMALDGERPQHPVRVSGFRIARTPVTTGLYREVMGGESVTGDPDLPANEVSWDDAIRFCNRLSRRQGYRPCYRERGLWPWRRWDCVWTADGYRLPTEAEWEYACRAGTRTRYSFGDDPAVLADYAWFNDNSDGDPHPVGSRRANPWGLSDMHGNVWEWCWEWCWDWYGGYNALVQSDPRGPTSGRGRVLRGGSFFNSPDYLRSANRVVDRPEDRDRIIGFRCVRGASPQR